MIFIQPIIFFAICVVIHLVQKKTEYNSDGKNTNVIRLSPFFRIVGWALCAFCSIFSIFMYYFSGILAALIIIFWGCISLFLVLGYYGFIVIYDGKKITYRRFFGKYKKIYYKQIVSIEYGLDLYVRTKDDTLKIPNYVTNVNEFYLYLNETVIIPDSEDKKVPRVRKFSDSVYRPVEFIFVYTLIIVIGFFVLGVVIFEYINGKIDQHTLVIAWVLGAIFSVTTCLLLI